MSSQEKFFCIPCNKELFLRNQRRHYDSQGHRTKFLTYSKKNGIVVSQENFENNQESKQVELCECAICMDEYPKPNHKSCSGCKQVWCNNCDKKLHTCPYCRHKIQGKQQLLVSEREERIREEQEVIRRQLERERNERYEYFLEMERQRQMERRRQMERQRIRVNVIDITNIIDRLQRLRENNPDYMMMTETQVLLGQLQMRL